MGLTIFVCFAIIKSGGRNDSDNHSLPLSATATDHTASVPPDFGGVCLLLQLSFCHRSHTASGQKRSQRGQLVSVREHRICSARKGIEKSGGVEVH